ncbi:MAG: acyl-CoA dehydrogenase [Sphingomonadales bacterium]|nr:MAG: acyl-CoA dehydrogenase [Sphingomonadales bacterium]
MHLQLSSDERAFQGEVRAFLDQVDPDLMRRERINASFLSDFDVNRAWHNALYARGWAAPNFPVEHGGTGWTPTQLYIFETELARAGAPPLWGAGIAMVAPVLLRYGSDEQKARLIPRILSGEDYWCQGYSEPGAGSDLASLQMRADRDGDDYVLNGTKIWTSHAHVSNKIFCLVRTTRLPKRQQGISFIIFDMDLPGITIQPIRTMDGSHEVNQVFFDNVRVPAENLIGAENDGWTVAKYLLEHERGGFIYAPRLRQRLHRAIQVAGATRTDNDSALDDPLIANRLAQISMDLDAFEMVELGMVAKLQAGTDLGVGASIAKLRGSEIRQSISEIVTDILGPESLYFAPDQLAEAHDFQDPLEQARAMATQVYLQDRAFTIFGGASEIQLSIIGRNVFFAATTS